MDHPLNIQEQYLREECTIIVSSLSVNAHSFTCYYVEQCF